MKGLLQFDIENPDYQIAETEQEKYRCAKKGYEMSGFIDSYLDYMIVLGPHIPMNELLEKLTNMYLNKLGEYEVMDMVQEDLREGVENFYDAELDEWTEEQLDKLRDEYVQKKLAKETNK